jgi:UDP-2,3-diacylglucosamine pyrophosphatase LpxH
MMGGGKETMSTERKLYALSDLHLQADHPLFLFTDMKEQTFVRIADEVLAADGTFLLAGDVFDLTGMTPPRTGLAAFFTTLGLKVPPAPGAPDEGSQVRAIHDRFPDFFAALAPLAEKDRLWIIPGNHDFPILTVDGQAALAKALGVPTGRLQLKSTVRRGRFLFAEHGHAYDSSNSTTEGWHNRGAVITAALYHAVTPALRELGVDDRVAYAVPCVRPEENIVEGLEQHLDRETATQLLLALVELLRVNRYFSTREAMKMWVATRLLKFLVTPERVRQNLADDTRLATSTRQHGNAIASGTASTDPPGATPTIVVMGHTHELDTTQEHYVNLGTWIDHVAGLTESELDSADLTLPVLVIDDDAAALYDCQNLLGPVAATKAIWRSP